MRRMLRVSPLLVPSFLLAVGLGTAATALSLQRALTSSSLPYPAADRLVTLIAGSKSWSGPMLDAVEARTTVFEALSLIQERAAVVGGDAGVEVVRVEAVSSAYFELLGARPIVGRAFSKEDDRRDAPGTGVVISDALWQRRLDADPSAIGRSIEIDRRRVAVLGVMPRGFRGLIGRTDVWLPLGTARWMDGEIGPERPWSRGFELFGRLRPGLALADANARFADEGRAAIESTGAADRILGANGRLRIVPLSEARVAPLVAQTTRVLGWAAAAVLIFVLVNLTSLALLRGDRRAREVRIRVALGATRARIARLAARDAAIVAVQAAAGAVLLRPLLTAAVVTIRPPSTTFGIVTAELLPGGVALLDPAAVGFVGAAAIVGGMLYAAALLLAANARRAAPDLRGGAITAGFRSWRSPAIALISVQAAVACVVLAGALLMLRSTTMLFSADRGYEWRDVITARVSLPDGPYSAANAGVFYDDVVARLAATPGIEQASVSSCAPGAGRCRQSNIMRVDGRDVPREAQPVIGINFVTPAHFATIRATTIRGRDLAAADRAGAPLAVIVSEPLAARLWPGADPIGHTLEIYTANGSLAGACVVVGVIRPLRFGADADDRGDVFLPAAQAAWTSGVIFAKSRLPARAVAAAIADAVGTVDRHVPVHDVASLEDRLGTSLGAELFLLRILMAFGVAGVLLAAVGAYATAAHAVARSRRELGVRIALGATSTQIWSLVGRRGVAVGLAGAIAGASGALMSSRLLASMLHGISARDPVALSLAPAVTVVGLLVAIAVPAWRASRVSAVVALRDE
ncbi:MAG TPA: ABC transporter permease [Vicinamibacterales bacterium]|nr:ABC transporter permease [Vicinamibacterales bacterium]